MGPAKVKNKIRSILNGPKKHILIACFQKSGSTYLYELLHEITGYKLVTLVHRWGNNEQDMYEDKLIKRDSINYISKQHVKGTENNIELIRKYSVEPIILVRNIYDVVCSLRDHFIKEDHKTPTGYVHREYFNMSDEEQLLYLARIHVPWYLNFFVSWLEASKNYPCIWTSYEEFFGDQSCTISKILDFLSIQYSSNQIVETIHEVSKKDTRFNVGRIGRGDALPQCVKNEIAIIADSWKLDRELWKKIGLDM